MIRREKGLELMKIVFVTHLSPFGLKSVVDLENYGFWKCDFNKRNSYLCYRGHEDMIENQFVVKMYLYLTCSVKLNIRNTKL